MRKTCWLSYDLGVGGDYESLYQWLDDKQALPCGNSVAYFHYEYKDGENLKKEIQEELLNKLTLKPGNILYLIRKEDDKTVGSFIYGKRQGTPWAGYGSQPSHGEDE